MITHELQSYFREYEKFPFVKTDRGAVSYGEVWKESEQGLKKWRYIEGKRVGLVATVHPETITLLCSLIQLNSQIVFLSPYEPLLSIHKHIQEGGIEVLFCGEEYKAHYKGSPVPVLSFGESDNQSFSEYGNHSQEVVSFSFIIMTSGSSSSPKKVVLTQDNFLTNAYYSNRNLPFHQGDTWLLSLPLFHVSGLSIIFPSKNARWWEGVFLPEVTHISVVSTIMKRLHEKGTLRKDRLKGILLGGGPIPAKLVEQCYKIGLPIYTTYGLTEMSSQVATTCTGDTLQHLLTDGKPLIPNTVRIDDEGCIWVRGPCRFQGYLTGDTIEKPFDNDGWFCTKDIGEWTSDGYLKIKGRKDNIFISAGENIQPEEIENCMMSSGFVNRGIVIPMKDEEYGQIPVAFVEYSESGSEDKLRGYLKERIAGIKIPRYFLPFPEEVEGGMKISRKQLIEWLHQKKEQKEL